ncbi:MAG: lipocalin family protein [Cyclobacteriaceae bacterium]
MKKNVSTILWLAGFMVLFSSCSKDEERVDYATLVIGTWYTTQEFNSKGEEMAYDDCEKLSTIQFTTSGDYIFRPFGTYWDNDGQPFCDQITQTPFMLTYTIVGNNITNDFGEGTIEKITNDKIRLRSEEPFSDLILDRVK